MLGRRGSQSRPRFGGAKSTGADLLLDCFRYSRAPWVVRWSPALSDGMAGARAVLSSRVPLCDVESVAADRTRPVLFGKTLLNAAALTGTEPCFSQPRRKVLAAHCAGSRRRRRMRVAVVFPRWDTRRYNLLDSPVLSLLNQHQRKRQAELGLFDNITLAQVRPHPTLDLNIVGAVNKEIWRVAVLRAIWQREREAMWLILEGRPARNQMASIISLPARSEVPAKVKAESADARRVRFGRPVARRLASPCSSSTGVRAESTPRFRWWTIDWSPTHLARPHLPPVAGSASLPIADHRRLAHGRLTAFLTGERSQFLGLLSDRLAIAGASTEPSICVGSERHTALVTREGLHVHIVTGKGPPSCP